MSNWRHSAACLDAVDADFFPVRQGGGEYEAAREVCHGCPVQVECLDVAMTTEGSRSGGARFGMRGGLTPAERATRYRAASRAEKAQR